MVQPVLWNCSPNPCCHSVHWGSPAAAAFARPYVCIHLVSHLFNILRQGFSVYPWLSWNSLCSPGRLESLEILPSAGMKGVHHRCLASDFLILARLIGCFPVCSCGDFNLLFDVCKWVPLHIRLPTFLLSSLCLCVDDFMGSQKPNFIDYTSPKKSSHLWLVVFHF